MAKKNKHKHNQQLQDKKREERSVKAAAWVSAYQGTDPISDYSKEFGVDKSRAIKDLQALGCDLSELDMQRLLLEENEQKAQLASQVSILAMLADVPDKISEGRHWLRQTKDYFIVQRELPPEDLEEYMHMAERYGARLENIKKIACMITEKLKEPNPDLPSLQEMLEKGMECLRNAKAIAYVADWYARLGFGSYKLIDKRKGIYKSEDDDEYDSWFDYRSAPLNESEIIQKYALRDFLKYSGAKVKTYAQTDDLSFTRSSLKTW
ncbi:MAG: hypothetical protein LBT59_21635 [Clostridiales bacterium]|jgi:hypothetical protein|nr:hypothetical protein [Clostridiales bacterium]